MNSWSIALRLARRELRGGLRGFRVFLACLTLGVAAIAGVGSLSQAIMTGIATDARAILGGDVSIRLVHRPATDDQLAYLDAAGTVSEAIDVRAMARTIAGDERSLIEIKAVDEHYPLYGALETDPPLPTAEVLEARDGVWGAAVAPGLLTRLGIGVGDRVRVGEATFDIRAVITGEPDAAGGVRGFTLGPRFLISTDAVGATELIQPGSMIYYFYRVRLAANADVGSWIAELNRNYPDVGWRVRDLGNAAPGLRRFIDRTTLFLTLVGLTALLVGGVGVGNAVHSYLEGKTAVIATLKCLGAPAALVFRTYLIQILLLALVGITVGLFIGAVTPMLSAELLADRLPVKARFAIYPAPLILASLFGALTALTFSIWPVARACEIPAGSLFRSLVAPVRQWPKPIFIAATALSGLALAGLAIATAEDRMFALWFVLGAAASLVLFRLAGAGVTRLARVIKRVRHPGLRLALANLHRPGAATIPVVLSLGLGLTVLVTIAQIEGNLGHQIRETLSEDAPAFFFIDIQPDQIDGFEALVGGMEGIRRVQEVPMLRGRIVEVDGIAADDAKVAPNVRWALRGDRGLTWAAAPPPNSEPVAGDWWPTDYSGEPLISLDAEVAEGFGVGLGDALTINVLGRNISGRIANLRYIDWGTMGINFIMVFSPGMLETAPQTHIATVYFNDGDDGGAGGVGGAVEKAVIDAYPNVSAIRVKDALDTVNKVIADVGIAIRATAAVALLAGMLVLAGAVAAGHRRRVYDAVVLKVLGARRRDVLGAFLIEYGLLGLITALIASVVGTMAGAAVVIWVMEFDWVFLPSVVVITAVSCTAITLVFGFAGTWQALGQKAAPLLRNE